MTTEQERFARIAAERGEEILRLRSRVEELEGALSEMVYFRKDDNTWRCACFGDHVVPAKVSKVLSPSTVSEE